MAYRIVMLMEVIDVDMPVASPMYFSFIRWAQSSSTLFLAIKPRVEVMMNAIMNKKMTMTKRVPELVFCSACLLFELSYSMQKPVEMNSAKNTIHTEPIATRFLSTEFDSMVSLYFVPECPVISHSRFGWREP